MGDGTANRFDPKGKGRATPKNDELALDLNSVEEGPNGNAGGAFMQMQLVEQQVRLVFLLLHPSFHFVRRTLIFSNGLMLSSLLKPLSQNSARFSLSSRIWSLSNEKQSNGLMITS